MFYISIAGQQKGPFTIDELKNNGLNHDSLVWTAGMPSWAEAKHVPQLSQALSMIPPPMPSNASAQGTGINPPPLPAGAPSPAVMYHGYKLAARRERLTAHIIQNLLFLLPFFMMFGNEIFMDDTQYDLEAFGLDVIAGAIFGAICGAIFYPLWAGNLGHKVMGLKVIKSTDGADYTSSLNGALREALKGSLGMFIIPGIWLLWDSNKQNLYDKMVGTIVVKGSKG